MPRKQRYLHAVDGRYYARKAVPKELRSIVGADERKILLGHDLRTAKRKLYPAVAEIDGEFEDAKQRLSAESKSCGCADPRSRGRSKDSNELARCYFDFFLHEDQHARETSPHREPKLCPDGERRFRKAASGELSDDELQDVMGYAIGFCELMELGLPDRGDPRWRAYLIKLAIAELELSRLREARNGGDWSAEPQVAFLKPRSPVLHDRAPEAPSNGSHRDPRADRPLSALVSLMNAERLNNAEATKNERVIAMRMFEELHGSKPVASISKRDIVQFKEALLETPRNYSNQFPGSTLREAIRRNKALRSAKPTLLPKTINDKWLAHLGAVLSWCVSNAIIDRNPATGVRVETGARREPGRTPFSGRDLALIFAMPEFRTGELDEFAWAILLALFTGARAAELAQIRLDGITKEKGVDVFSISGKVKNLKSNRRVPIAEALVKLGLSKRVIDLRSRGEQVLFPEWFARAREISERAATRGKVVEPPYANVLPEKFNRRVARLGIDRKRTFHTFRHTFKTELSALGIAKQLSDLITGHTDSSASAGYIHEAPLTLMKEAIERLRFESVDHLIASKS